MLDGWIRPYIDPPLNRAAGYLAWAGMSPNGLTSLGLGFAAACFVALAMQFYVLALGALLLNRLCDGLDGPVARHAVYRARRAALNAAADKGFGAYFDILSDFIFYAGVPFFFALGVDWGGGDVWRPTAFLLLGFVLSGVSFLAYAVMAEKNALTTTQQGKKGFYYMVGLMEGTETILFFVAMMVFPALYPALCWVFGGLCVVTMVGRLALARANFS